MVMKINKTWLFIFLAMPLVTVCNAAPTASIGGVLYISTDTNITDNIIGNELGRIESAVADGQSVIPPIDTAFYAAIVTDGDEDVYANVTMYRDAGNDLVITAVHESSELGIYSAPILPSFGPTIRIVSTFAAWDLADSFRGGYDVLACEGQSNMDGRDNVQYALQRASEYIYQLNVNGSGDSKDKPIRLADASGVLQTGISVAGQGNSPCYAFAQRYLENTGYKRPVLIVIHAKGSTGLVGENWTSTGYWSATIRSGLGGDGYIEFKRRLQLAMDTHTDNKLIAVLSAQGEDDTLVPRSESAYSAAKVALINGVLGSLTPTDWQSADDFMRVPYITIGFSPEWMAQLGGRDQGVTNALVNLKNVRPFTGHVDTRTGHTGLARSGDEIHYSTKGAFTLGKEAADMIASVRHNVASESGPVAPGGVTSTLSGDRTIETCWDAVTAYPAVDYYTLRYSTSTSGPWTTVDTADANTLCVTVQNGVAGATINYSTDYYFAVASHNTHNSGTLSGYTASATYPINSGTGLAAPSTDLSPVVASNPTETTVDLTWTADTSGNPAPYYLITASNETTPSVYDIVVRNAGNNLQTNSYTVTGLTGGTDYKFQVQAENSQGQGTTYVTANAITTTAPLTGDFYGAVDTIATRGTNPITPIMYFITHPNWITLISSGPQVAQWLGNNDRGNDGYYSTYSAFASTYVSTTGNHGLSFHGVNSSGSVMTLSQASNTLGANLTVFIRFKTTDAAFGTLFSIDGTGPRITSAAGNIDIGSSAGTAIDGVQGGINDGNWHVVALECLVAGGVNLYIDGTSVTNTEGTMNCSSGDGTQSVRLAARYTGTAFVDNLAVTVSNLYAYNVNLSPTDRNAIINELVGWTEL
jgi:hypothetical protein